MVTRVWHGWTTPANAHLYQNLLQTEIFTGIAARRIAGYRGISLCRRDVADEVEFMTVMWFDSLEGVRDFAGDAYEQAVVPPEARAVLSRFDATSAHYETVVPPAFAASPTGTTLR